jgi:alkaline phosphatase D
MGRTKTAPTNTERLRLGVVSCSSYAHGVFNAYRMLAKRADIDAVLHLGDYIYEYATGQYGNARPYEPATEMISLADIRERHAYYKRTDVDLQEVHRQHPFITVWDDHETTNDSYTNGAENHTEGAPPTGEGNWPQRKAWGQQAYDEWMPIRLPEAGNPNKIWRTLPYGDLVELIMLDTRLFSRSQPTSLTAPTANTIAADPTRSLLGNEQRLFLEDRLKNSPARWKVVGQQVMVAPFKLAPGINGAAGGGQYFNYDQWDGYQADRSKLFNFMRSNSLNNVVILTGDIHSSWAHDLTEDPNNPAVYNPGVIANGTVVSASTGSVGVEYVVPSVTSPGFEQIPGFSNADESVLAPNPHLKYFDGTRRGYCVMDITPARFQCEWWYVPQIATRADAESFGAAWKCDHNSKRQSPSTVSAPVMGAAGLAP